MLDWSVNECAQRNVFYEGCNGIDRNSRVNHVQIKISDCTAHALHNYIHTRLLINLTISRKQSRMRKQWRLMNLFKFCDTGVSHGQVIDIDAIYYSQVRYLSLRNLAISKSVTVGQVLCQIAKNQSSSHNSNFDSLKIERAADLIRVRLVLLKIFE